MNRAVLAALLAGLALASCGSTHGPGLEDQTSCLSRPAPVVALGELGPGEIPGNSYVVSAKVAVGRYIRVTVQYGDRSLSYPASDSPALRRVCSSDSANVYESLFIGESAGTAEVQSYTVGCGPCANLGFVARVSVVPAEPQVTT